MVQGEPNAGIRMPRKHVLIELSEDGRGNSPLHQYLADSDFS